MDLRSVHISRFVYIIGIISLLSEVTAFYSQNLTVRIAETKATEQRKEGIVGRVVQIPARDYTLAFKVEAPKLGDCALTMQEGGIKTCKAKFGGNEVFIPKASTDVDVSRIESTEDVLTHGMGGLGLNVGVLGLVSVGWKTNVAVTTQTTNRHLTLMSSYDLQRGMLTLQNPQSLSDVGPEGALYLSEIEMGGNEMFMVTMEFESEQKKVEVESTLSIKILFISISAKVKYVSKTFKSASKTRIQFRSSWRPQVDSTYTSLTEALPEIERIEAMYTMGPTELSKLDIQDPKLHNNYYFAAWKTSPFGESMNMAAINNDMNTLGQQQLEVQAVIHRIADLLKMYWKPEKKADMEKLNNTISNIGQQLNKGIQLYHGLSFDERTKLRNIYGDNRAPDYYSRKLKAIAGY